MHQRNVFHHVIWAVKLTSWTTLHLWMSYAYTETGDVISSGAGYIESMFDNVETEIIGKRIKTHNPISWLLLFLGTSTVYDVNKSVYA